jgi:murein L,D-transpeptidase YcbB/YkuD
MHTLHAHAVVAAAAVLLATLSGRPLGEPLLVPSSTDASPCDEASAAALLDLVDGNSSPDVEDFYAAGPRLLWTRGGRPTAAARAGIESIGSADLHGLDPARYDAEALRDRARALGSLPGCEPAAVAELELSLSGALAAFLTDVHQGRVAPAGSRLVRHDDLTLATLRNRIEAAIAAGDVASLDTALEPGFAQYRHLKRALARLPTLPERGPESTVLADRIGLALDRLRWLPHAPDGPLIVANIPAFRLVAFRAGRDERPALRMPIVVGRASRTRTPIFVDDVSQVLFRPPWYPPASIVRNEILPALARDARYLDRAGLDIVSPGGTTLPPNAENLARLRSGALALRQPPGPQNALGLVKFVFPNDYRVYMHDTPARGLFARPRRDFSHGCIRVQDAPALAAFVLDGAPGWTAEAIAAAMNGPRTLAVRVDPPIPVYIAYTTTIARPDGTVELFDDVYGLDESVFRALEESDGIR